MKSSLSAKLLSSMPSSIIMWQICLIICSITPMIFLVSPAKSQTIAQVVVGRNISRPNLKIGSQGESVSELQAALKLLGFYTGKVDGKYGNSTASAVSKFKQAAGLKPDGIVDRNTWQKLFPGQQLQVPNQQTSTQQISTQQVSTRQISTLQTLRQGNRNSSQVSVSSQTTQTTTNLPEPKPVRPKPTTANNTKPEPRPAKPKLTTAARTRKKPTQTTQKQTSSTKTRQTSRTRGSRSPSARRASRSRAIQKRRTQQSRKLFGTSRKPYLQYTAQGLPILRQGAKGSEVVTLQTRLKKRGFLKGKVDGDFGKQTLAAVQAFQKRYGLTDDGIVGGATWRILLRR